MYRFDRNGRNVTGLPGPGSFDDVGITTSQYDHPDIKSGQHTNGPANVFARKLGGEWVRSTEKSMHKTVRLIVERGFHALENAK